MKVELSIADDREMRDTIRDLIKGEVASIMRGEIKGIVAELVKEDVIPKDAKTLGDIVRSEVRKYVSEQLLGSNSYSNNPLREIAREEVAKLLKESLKTNQLNIK